MRRLKRFGRIVLDQVINDPPPYWFVTVQNYDPVKDLKIQIRLFLETLPSAFGQRQWASRTYSGVMVLENLPPGAKVWINTAVREIQTGKRVGQKYLAISLRPFNQDGGNV